MSKRGRPPLFKSPKEFDEAVERYLAECEAKDTPLTLTGLAYSLGFSDKTSLYDYEKKDEFSHSVKKARLAVENSYEMRLYGANASGPIFALKNFGWRDKQEVEHSVGVNARRDPFDPPGS